MSNEGISGALGSGVEERLERLAGMAGRLLGVPVALTMLPDGAAIGGPATPVRSLAERVMETGAALNVADVASESWHGATVAAFAGVPLRLGWGTGALCVGDIEPRAWSNDELGLLEGLAAAVEAGTRLEAADSAWAAAERVELAVLHDVSERLSTVRTVDEAAEVALSSLVELLGAVAGTVWMRRADGSFAVVAAVGTGSVDADGPPADLSSPVDDGPLLHMPLRGEVIDGAMTLAWPQGSAPVPEMQALAIAVADQAVHAMERARLRQREREAQGRLAFLADASRVLTDSLDFDETLATLARLTVPAVADVCTVHLVDERGPMIIAAAATEEAIGTTLSDRVARRDRRGDPLVDQVLRDGEAAVDPQPGVAQPAADERVAVPMRAHGRLIGVLTLAMRGSGRQFSDDAGGWLADLAARAAAAVDNARLYHARKAEAETLQRSLLPPSLPLIPGLEAEARYRPATEAHQVGGDFFDVFAAGGGRWGIMMGDVSGKGIAAAALTSLVRYTVRAVAQSADEPSDVLLAVNRAVLDAVGDRFCTAAFGFVEPRSDGAVARIALGGHPRPVVVDATGALHEVGRQGTALGVVADPQLEDETVELAAGDSIVLFTDGAVEVKGPDGRWAEHLVERTLAAAGGSDAAGLASALEEAVLSFSGGSPRDDLGILVLRAPDAGDRALESPVEERLPAHLVSSFFARQRARPWLAGQALGTRRAEDIVLVVSELVTNAARAGHELVLLRLWRTKDHVVVEVTDDGEGFVPPSDTSLPAPESEAGRGLYLVWNLADEVQVNPGPSGTVVRCRFRL